MSGNEETKETMLTNLYLMRYYKNGGDAETVKKLLEWGFLEMVSRRSKRVKLSSKGITQMLQISNIVEGEDA